MKEIKTGPFRPKYLRLETNEVENTLKTINLGIGVTELVNWRTKILQVTFGPHFVLRVEAHNKISNDSFLVPLFLYSETSHALKK